MTRVRRRRIGAAPSSLEAYDVAARGPGRPRSPPPWSAPPASRSTASPAGASPTPAGASGSSTAPATASASRSTRTPTSSRATTTPLEPGHAFSVEPGVYLPGKWGIRLEDIVVAADDGPDRLQPRPITRSSSSTPDARDRARRRHLLPPVGHRRAAVPLGHHPRREVGIGYGWLMRATLRARSPPSGVVRRVPLRPTPSSATLLGAGVVAATGRRAGRQRRPPPSRRGRRARAGRGRSRPGSRR